MMRDQRGIWKKPRRRAAREPRRVYIAEGETEEHFVGQLTEQDLIFSGQFHKVNLMQTEIKDTSSLLDYKGKSILYCIIDTDRAAPDNLDKLKHNLSMLLTGYSRVYILVQNKMLEDELAFMLNRSLIRPLCEFLGGKPDDWRGKKKFKRFLKNRVCYNVSPHVITKELMKKYCTRPQGFRKLLQKNATAYADVIAHLSDGTVIIRK